MSLNLLEHFVREIENIDFSKKGTKCIINFFESILMSKTYFLPEQLIEDRKWALKIKQFYQIFEKKIKEIYDDNLLTWFNNYKL